MEFNQSFTTVLCDKSLYVMSANVKYSVFYFCLKTVKRILINKKGERTGRGARISCRS